VPPTLRQSLSVESGLNDGLALPLVIVFSSLASIGEPSSSGHALTGAQGAVFAMQQVSVALVAGAVIGFVGAKLIDLVEQRGLMSETYHELAGIALALLAALGSDTLGGNGFIAAFVAGLAFGNANRGDCARLFGFAEAEGTLLMLVTFFATGAVFVPHAIDAMGWATVGYALLSLTVIRMVPVALSLIGVPMRPATLLFLGWFGPRGLASILFVVLILDEMAAPHAQTISEIVMVTVVLSVVMHGVTASPGAVWIERRQRAKPCPTAAHVPSAHAYRRRHHLLRPAPETASPAD